MKRIIGYLSIFSIALFTIASCSSIKPIANINSQNSLSEDMAKTVMTVWADSLSSGNGRPVRWSYDQGVLLEGIANIWKRTGDARYFNYIQKSMDHFVQEDGNIRTYKISDYNIDNVKNGRSLLLLYKVTGKEKYYKAASLLRKQLEDHPRTNEGGFWHKKIYPYQMWLDGLYMGQPFYSEWAATFHQPEAFDDVANQFIYMENHSIDPKTGLLYHGWDESKAQQWANKETGTSPHFWGRAMGWYGMGLVDVLENFPQEHPKRQLLINILNRFATSIEKVQDKKTGLWYQVMDMPDGKGNYLEASASNMFVYALAKGVRLGYLPSKFEAAANKAYQGIQKNFLERDNNGLIHLNGTVSVAGLGGKPYRDGSYEYYLSEKVIQDDPKGVGAFLLASNEMELRAIPQVGEGKTIMLDNYFNNEFKKDITGKQISFHYHWNEWDHPGFGLLGEYAKYMGAKIHTLKAAPTVQNLSNADVYIIVDPDTKKETPQPNFMNDASVEQIKTWVNNGGVLLLMANDSTNAELDKFNKLSTAFGIEFKKEMKNPVTGTQFEMGLIKVQDGNPIFKTARNLYLKEISTLNLTAPAQSVLDHKGDVVMAIAKMGKGTVFAVGDPWLYNEYTDGRRLPATYDNFTAGNELMMWLLQQVPSNK